MESEIMDGDGPKMAEDIDGIGTDTGPNNGVGSSSDHYTRGRARCRTATTLNSVNGIGDFRAKFGTDV